MVSQGGSFVSVAFYGEDVRIAAHHAAQPLKPGERIGRRMITEQREGRRLDNSLMPRDARIVANVVIAFLVNGSVPLG